MTDLREIDPPFLPEEVPVPKPRRMEALVSWFRRRAWPARRRAGRELVPYWKPPPYSQSRVVRTICKGTPMYSVEVRSSPDQDWRNFDVYTSEEGSRRLAQELLFPSEVIAQYDAPAVPPAAPGARR